MTWRVYTHGKRLALGAPTTAAAWVGETCMFALGDGAVVAATFDGSTRVIAHDGAALCATPHPDGAGLLTGGDDGRIALTTPAGETETFAALGRKWVDHIAASSATSVIAAAQGKEAVIFKAGAREPSHRFAYPSTLGGLAFDAKGRRIAAAHYGGATLRYALIEEDTGSACKWAGSHIGVTLSPESDYVITAMQETGLHGWRLPDKLDLRMTGYPAKTRSFSWDKRGKWLASSGANCVVIWPFSGKLGPQGKPPVLIGERPALVTAVAFHPKDERIAIGYSDGLARIEKLDDRDVMIELDEPGEGAVTALAWSGDGTALAIGDDAARGALIRID